MSKKFAGKNPATTYSVRCKRKTKAKPMPPKNKPYISRDKKGEARLVPAQKAANARKAADKLPPNSLESYKAGTKANVMMKSNGGAAKKSGRGC